MNQDNKEQKSKHVSDAEPAIIMAEDILNECITGATDIAWSKFGDDVSDEAVSTLSAALFSGVMTARATASLVDAVRRLANHPRPKD